MKNKIPEAPHCPGEIHASPVKKITMMMPKFAGLKKCLPPDLKINLQAIAKKAAKAYVERSLAFNKIVNPKDVITALLSEEISFLKIKHPKACVPRQVDNIMMSFCGSVSHPSAQVP